MQKSIHKLLKEMYNGELKNIPVPPCPFPQPAVGGKKHPFSRQKITRGLLKAACVIMILTGVLTLSLTHPSGDQPLALIICEFSAEYQLMEKIPAGIEYIQKEFQSLYNSEIDRRHL